MSAAGATDILDDPALRDRKAEHIGLALERRMQGDASAFDDYRFGHEALPEIDFDEIDLGTEFLGRRLSAPLLISCMTGGTEIAGRINRNLALAAEATGVAIGVGSQRKALEDPAKADTFRIRDEAPSVPRLANLGAVQLNYGMGLDDCRRAVEMIGADALVFHLNPLQEAIQPEGQRNFAGLLDRMAEIARALPVPIIVKEVGSGLSEATGRALASRGLTILDTAGVGGTSWARIEAARAADLEIGELFAAWGIETPESITALAGIGGLTIIGSGGVRNGLDVAKALALGATLAGMAYPFLEAATESPERVIERIERTIRELKIAMFCLGQRTPAALARVRIEQIRVRRHRSEPLRGTTIPEALRP
ncbi:MAG TPA: type 2 isopentenyl-diphosphate Delta-isomerase [Thermoanaerobaculia bacterium]|nr:type 2 isopentenyl-diphosphate Delta-isomerase [Thermoanaerobaculia bacterium]